MSFISTLNKVFFKFCLRSLVVVMGNSTRMTKMLIHFNLALHRVGQGQGGGGGVGGAVGVSGIPKYPK